MCNAYRSKSTQKCTPHLRHSTGLAGMGFLLFSLALERFAVVSFFTIAVEASTDNKNKNTTACGTEKWYSRWQNTISPKPSFSYCSAKKRSHERTVSTSNLSTFLLFRLCCCWHGLVQLVLLLFFCQKHMELKTTTTDNVIPNGRASEKKVPWTCTLIPYPLYFHCLLQLYNIICWHYHDKGNLKVSRNLNWI